MIEGKWKCECESLCLEVAWQEIIFSSSMHISNLPLYTILCGKQKWKAMSVSKHSDAHGKMSILQWLKPLGIFCLTSSDIGCPYGRLLQLSDVTGDIVPFFRLSYSASRLGLRLSTSWSCDGCHSSTYGYIELHTKVVLYKKYINAARRLPITCLLPFILGRKIFLGFSASLSPKRLFCVTHWPNLGHMAILSQRRDWEAICIFSLYSGTSKEERQWRGAAKQEY